MAQLICARGQLILHTCRCSFVVLPLATVIASPYKQASKTHRAGESILCPPGSPQGFFVSATTLAGCKHGVCRSQKASKHYSFFFNDQLLEVVAGVVLCIQGIFCIGVSA